jgi:hypothetical protein
MSDPTSLWFSELSMFTLTLLLCQVDLKECESLKNAKAMKIQYYVKTELKTLLVEAASDLKQLTAGLQLEDADKGAQAGAALILGVTFVLPDGKEVKTMFLTRTQLDRSDWGQIYLKNTTFYEKVTALVGKKEGTPFDPIKK